jgi:SPP1 family predicted phage head-tail adaptor
MTFNNVLELAKIQMIVNDNGVEEPQLITTEIYCNEKSVTGNEFYQSSQNGIVISTVFQINFFEYNNEQYVIYKSKKYKIARTYKTDSNIIELHCTMHEGLIA